MSFVHETAVVDPGAEIGSDAKIWHFCHVSAGAVIGARATLGQNCYVAPTAHIGPGCKIQNNVSVYDGVTLERDVFVGPSAVFTNVRTPRAHVSRRDEYEEKERYQGAACHRDAPSLGMSGDLQPDASSRMDRYTGIRKTFV